jgi:Base plate wedge protein 53
MARPYFRQVPDLDYVSRLPNAKISDYIRVKNLFRKGKLREDIFQNLNYFTKYQIKGNDRPDNVAFEVYGDSSLDWVILISNNILNIQTEWPMSQDIFDAYLLEKYGGYDTLYSGVHHYETISVRNSAGVEIVKAGLTVPENFQVRFYDDDQQRQIIANNITVPIVNYDHEQRLEDAKRNIFVLKGQYLHLVFEDTEDIMRYKKGSSQYMSGTLKKGDNIRLYS